MAEIKKLTKLTFEQLRKLGEQSYSSEFKYNISREYNGDEISFRFKQVKLENPFEKKWIVTDSIYEDYLHIVHQGNSFGAYEKDDLVGFIISDKRDWNNSLWIEMIQVADEFRNKGTGSKLLAVSEEHAKENKFRMIELETQNTNIPAINFYRKNSYELSGLNLNLYDPEKVKNEIAIFMSKII
ncbi:MAG TPA: GNAT family N-acetyltransferase [Ignavibacteria bacterium]|nr:GNAT family N-acetyltransferase [Ignavibacteria bacterium]